MIFDVPAMPQPLSDVDAKKMRQTISDIRRGRFGSGNFATSDGDNLKADVLALREGDMMVRRLLVDRHEQEERLEEIGLKRMGENTLSSVIGTRRTP